MFDRRITTSEATLAGVGDHLTILGSLVSTLRDLAIAEHNNAASQHAPTPPDADIFASRYAAANSITRRRFDAKLREVETVARMGFGVIAARHGGSDAGTIAAAHFLGKNIETALRRLEKLLTPQAI